MLQKFDTVADALGLDDELLDALLADLRLELGGRLGDSDPFRRILIEASIKLPSFLRMHRALAEATGN